MTATLLHDFTLFNSYRTARAHVTSSFDFRLFCFALMHAR
jgi:hypothetical protein